MKKPARGAQVRIVVRLGRIALTVTEPVPGGTCKRTVAMRMTDGLRAAVCAAVAAGDYKAAADAVCEAAKAEAR